MAPPGAIPADAIRKPSVAGQFYPDSSSQLQHQVDDLFDQAASNPIDGDIVALVAPHAGYTFSGRTAAAAFKQIAGRLFDTVFVLCPSHRDYFYGVSVYTGKGYETPLGVVPIDQERARRLIKYAPDIIHETTLGHREEHAIEVELPFLQEILSPSWKLVPLVMADRTSEVCKSLADAIVTASEGISVMIVASSDLYHGYSYTDCHAIDEQTLHAVEDFNPDAFLQGLENDTYQACGGGPIAVTMMAARRSGADAVRIIAHTTSGDVTGRHDGYVVGYGAAAFYRKTAHEVHASKAIASHLTETERRQLLTFARKALVDTVHHAQEIEAPPVAELSGQLTAPCGVFVTLRRHEALRGCIGQVHATTPLYQTVQHVTRASALQDPRFPPVRPEELDGLTICISVLGALVPLSRVHDLQIGVHGLYIRQRNSTGLLLPQVATDRGWDRETFLSQTCQKAGLPPDAWQDPETEIMYFPAEVFGEESE